MVQFSRWSNEWISILSKNKLKQVFQQVWTRAPEKNIKDNAGTPTVRKRKAGAFNLEKSSRIQKAPQ